MALARGLLELRAEQPPNIERVAVASRGGRGGDAWVFRCMLCPHWASKPGAHRNRAYEHVRKEHPEHVPKLGRRGHPPEPAARKRERKQQRQNVLRRAKREATAEQRAALAAQGSVSLLPEAAVLTTGGIFGVSACVTPGRGRRLLLGNLDRSGREAMHLAVSWVGLHARRLKAWGGAPPPPPLPLPPEDPSSAASGGAVARQRHSQALYTQAEDVVVRLSELEVPKGGPSLGACGSLSLVQYLWRHRPCLPDVGVTGIVDLRGRLLPVGGIEDKAERAELGGVSRFILPQAQYDEYSRDDFAKLLPSGEACRAYARRAFRGATTMLDVLRHAFEGFEPDAAMTRSLDDPQLVGVGRGFDPDSGRVLEVECCLVRPVGIDGGLLVSTGVGEEESDGRSEVLLRESGWAMLSFVEDKAPAIVAAVLGQQQQQRRMLVKARHGLHVHIPLWVQTGELGHTGLQAGMAVAMVSLLLGRRPRRGVAALGDVTPEGLLSPFLRPLTTADVEACVRGGVRELVVAEDFEVEDEARARVQGLGGGEAGEEEEGRPRLRLVRVENLLDGLRTVFLEQGS